MRRTNYLDNAALEAAIRAGDRDQVARLLYTLADHVVGMQLHKLPPGLEADEVAQVAVIEAMRRLALWVPERSTAFSYATGSVKFTILAEVKRERTWAQRHSALALEFDEEAVPC